MKNGTVFIIGSIAAAGIVGWVRSAHYKSALEDARSANEAANRLYENTAKTANEYMLELERAYAAIDSLTQDSNDNED